MEAQEEGLSIAEEEMQRVRAWAAAMLRRAAWDFALYRHYRSGKKAAIFRDAHKWIFLPPVVEEDIDRFATFEYICMILDLDPDHARETVLKLRRKDLVR